MALMVKGGQHFAQSSAARAATRWPWAAAAPADTPSARRRRPRTPRLPGSSGNTTTIKDAGKLTPVTMFINATWVVKTVILGLALCSILSWALLVTRLLEFASLNRESDSFLEAFPRGAQSITDINRIASGEEYEGNPMADMAAAASAEVELSRQAGLKVDGEHRDSTIARAGSAVAAVQASVVKRLSGGMAFLASLGANAPFVGLFGTVYGIMYSFIGIANTNTTNLAAGARGHRRGAAGHVASASSPPIPSRYLLQLLPDAHFRVRDSRRRLCRRALERHLASARQGSLERNGRQTLPGFRTGGNMGIEQKSRHQRHPVRRRVMALVLLIIFMVCAPLTVPSVCTSTCRPPWRCRRRAPGLPSRSTSRSNKTASLQDIGDFPTDVDHLGADSAETDRQAGSRP